MTIRPWKVNLAYSTCPVTDGGGDSKKSVRDSDTDEEDHSESDGHKLVINKPAILNEIARLGGELVERIQVNR